MFEAIVCGDQLARRLGPKWLVWLVGPAVGVATVAGAPRHHRVSTRWPLAFQTADNGGCASCRDNVIVRVLTKGPGSDLARGAARECIDV